MRWLLGEKHTEKHTKISNEIDYFMELYGTLHPTVFLSYEREVYYAKDGTSFRVTFDDNILCRHENLSLGIGLIMAQSFSDSELTFAVVILSSPDIKKGETYTISVGSESGEFKAS